MLRISKKSSRQVIKERIENTVCRLVNTDFILAQWTPEDDRLPISWQIASTLVGEALVASTLKGVCFLGFTNGDHTFALTDLQRRFPSSLIKAGEAEWNNGAINYLNHPELNIAVRLHLKGTDFQLYIWKKLMLIPFGGLVTYKDLGNGAHNARAAGAAVGANPISYILPCHRAVRADGSFDRYYWGAGIKRKLIAFEASRTCIKE